MFPATYLPAFEEVNQWILSQRPSRNAVDPSMPYAFLLEQENIGNHRIGNFATVFLTNSECPWHCLMCDLWKNTLTESVPPGAIPGQIDFALRELGVGFDTIIRSAPLNPPVSERELPRPRVSGMPFRMAGLKLYNSGSFFDPRAIPVEDYPAIAERAANFERVIVECHPALVGERVLRFRDLLTAAKTSSAVDGEPQQRGAKLEVAMGLETAHPEVLERLNKRMTLDDFARAADFLRSNDIALRAFVLVKPPFLTDEAEALHWARRSIDFAFDHGAAVVSVIPTRPGNGAMEALLAQGQFAPPKLATLEAALDYGFGLERGRVFADIWDLEKFSDCPACFAQRRSRLQDMNLSQSILPAVSCNRCT